MSGSNIDMLPILTWISEGTDRQFSMRSGTSSVGLRLQDNQRQCEQWISFAKISHSKMSQLDFAVEKMLQALTADDCGEHEPKGIDKPDD